MTFQSPFRLGVRLLWTSLLGASILAILGAAPALAGEGRWVAVGPVVGYRSFAAPLELDPEFAIGARVSLGVSDRVVVTIDGGHAEPTRTTSGIVSSFGDIRALVAYRLKTSGVRPYLLTGVGGQIMNFHDAPASASAVVAAGAGAELDLADAWVVVVEGSANLYRGRLVTYNSTGQELTSTPRETYATGIFSLGILYRF